MIIPEFDQNIARLQAFNIQYQNGYHLSENDIKEFDKAIEFFEKYKNIVKGTNNTL